MYLLDLYNFGYAPRFGAREQRYADPGELFSVDAFFIKDPLLLKANQDWHALNILSLILHSYGFYSSSHYAFSLIPLVNQDFRVKEHLHIRIGEEREADRLGLLKYYSDKILNKLLRLPRG